MEQPIFDSRNIEFKRPFGAVSETTPVYFKVQLPPRLAFSEVILKIYSSNESLTELKMVYKETTNVAVCYDALFSPPSPDIYYYYFSVAKDGHMSFIKRNKGSNGELTDNETDWSSFQLTVYKKGAKTPDSIKGGIIYQIMPDRFCYSGQPKQNVPKDRLLRADFYGLPNFVPDETGTFTSDDYFCGDLKGIEQKLSYLKSLGVTVIYLNPIFEAHSNHRYNTADYLKVDPLLGSYDDFVRLCRKAKHKGIKIILDGVFNHTGDDSVYFNREGRYPNAGAYNSKTSKYYNWYTFNDYPDNYLSWWGFDTLPAIRRDCDEFQDFICSENGVLHKWLNAGASGFRLDVVDELSGSFVEKIRKSVKSHNEENYLVGEVWEDASNKEAYGEKKRYFLGDQLDGVMNYPFRTAIIRFLREFNKSEFTESVMTVVENYPPQNLNVVMNLLSSHDVPRILTSLAGEPCEGKDRNWQSRHNLSIEEYQYGVKLLKCAFVLAYFLPGLPCIYYGDEAGLFGYKDPFNRKCYPWNNEDKNILDFVKTLGKLRSGLTPQLKDGVIEFLPEKDGILAFSRTSGDKKLIVFLNYSSDKQTVWYDYKNLKLIYGKQSLNKEIKLNPYSFALAAN